jgi:hypothetical protein
MLSNVEWDGKIIEANEADYDYTTTTKQNTITAIRMSEISCC